MKNYIRPNMEVSKFDVADIITASGDAFYAASLPEADKTIYDEYVAAATAAGNTAGNVAAVFQW